MDKECKLLTPIIKYPTFPHKWTTCYLLISNRMLISMQNNFFLKARAKSLGNSHSLLWEGITPVHMKLIICYLIKWKTLLNKHPHTHIGYRVVMRLQAEACIHAGAGHMEHLL
jgi:hypothetical protein